MDSPKPSIKSNSRKGTSSHLPALQRDILIEDSVKRVESEGYFARCCSCCCLSCSYILLAITFPVSIFMCINIVQEFQRAVIFRLGRLRSGEARGPGIFFTLPCTDDIRVIDIRTMTCTVDPQEILTKDSVTVAVDAVVYNPLNAVVKVTNYHNSTKLLASSILRNVLGTKTLTELLTERENIARIMQINLDGITNVWGIKVERVEIKDVRLPVPLQRAMATEAEAARTARAKVITAEGEKKAAQSLKEASDIISKSEAALQLRYLDTLNSIASEHTTTIVFPIPMGMMRGVFGEK